MKAGIAKIDITPPLGAVLNGYYRERYADHVIEPLYVTALAFSDGTNTAGDRGYRFHNRHYPVKNHISNYFTVFIYVDAHVNNDLSRAHMVRADHFGRTGAGHQHVKAAVCRLIGNGHTVRLSLGGKLKDRAVHVDGSQIRISQLHSSSVSPVIPCR